MKRILFAVILFILLLSIQGCWDRTELDNIGIVNAMALDKDPATGKIILTCQVVRPEALRKDGGGNQSSTIEIVTDTGDTVREAMRKITKQIDRKGFFAHTKVIIVSEPLAREGMLPYLDFYLRSYNTRNLAWLLVAKGAWARDILGVKHGIDNVQATYLDRIIARGEESSEASNPDLLEYFQSVTSDEINPIAGAIEIIQLASLPAENKKEPVQAGVQLAGTAIFKKDKLTGYFNAAETRGLNWITGRVKRGIINVPAPDSRDQLVALEVKKASRKITPELQNGKPYFRIEVKAESDIAEQQDAGDYFNNPGALEKLELAQKAAIEQEIKMALVKAQELNSDVFGFGSAVRRKYPQEWKTVRSDWSNLFLGATYEIQVDAKLNRLGMLLKPITGKN